MSLWTSGRKNKNVVRIISDTELDPTTSTALTIILTGMINLKVKHQPVIKGSTFRKLFKLKQNHEEKS